MGSRPASRKTAAADRRALADRVHSAAIHVLRRVRRVDAASGLTAPRLSALSVVVFAGPITLGQLAAAEQVRPPTMTRIVQALVAKGLVRREPNPRDLREVRLRATPRGRAVLARGRARRVAALARGLRHLSERDAKTLATAVDVLERLLQRSW